MKYTTLFQKPSVDTQNTNRILTYKPNQIGASTRQNFDFYKKQPTDTESVGYNRHKIRIYFPNNTRPVLS